MCGCEERVCGENLFFKSLNPAALVVGFVLPRQQSPAIIDVQLLQRAARDAARVLG